MFESIGKGREGGLADVGVPDVGGGRVGDGSGFRNGCFEASFGRMEFAEEEAGGGVECGLGSTQGVDLLEGSIGLFPCFSGKFEGDRCGPGGRYYLDGLVRKGGGSHEGP